LSGAGPYNSCQSPHALDMEALTEAEAIDDDFGTGLSVTTRVLSAEHLAAIALRTGRGKEHIRIDSFVEQDVLDLVRFKLIVLS
jgi:hypothetical protein